MIPTTDCKPRRFYWLRMLAALVAIDAVVALTLYKWDMPPLYALWVFVLAVGSQGLTLVLLAVSTEPDPYDKANG